MGYGLTSDLCKILTTRNTHLVLQEYYQLRRPIFLFPLARQPLKIISVMNNEVSWFGSHRKFMLQRTFWTVTETFISSTFQIPTFRAANITARDKLWKRERKLQKRCNPPANGLSEILKARQVWQLSIKVEYRMYLKPSTKLAEVSQALGIWSWAVKAALWSGFAFSLCLSFLNRDPLGSLCPQPRWQARIQAQVSTKLSPSTTLCTSGVVLPDPQILHKILK